MNFLEFPMRTAGSRDISTVISEPNRKRFKIQNETNAMNYIRPGSFLIWVVVFDPVPFCTCRPGAYASDLAIFHCAMFDNTAIMTRTRIAGRRMGCYQTKRIRTHSAFEWCDVLLATTIEHNQLNTADDKIWMSPPNTLAKFFCGKNLSKTHRTAN